MKCRRPSKLKLTHVKYDFLSLLPVTEPLAIRGRRLNATPQQRQNKVYAPDIFLTVEVEDASRRLHATFVDDRHLVLAEGERKQMNMWLHNTGTQTINEVWIVSGREDELWIEVTDQESSGNFSWSLNLPEFMSLNIPRVQMNLSLHRPKCSNRAIHLKPGNLSVYLSRISTLLQGWPQETVCRFP